MTRGCVWAGVAVLLLAGCGSSTAARRTAVNRYFDRVDAVERSFAAGLSRAQRTYDSFGKQGSVTESYAAAAQTFVRLRRKIAALEAPPDARPVRRDLLRMLTLEIALAHEVGAFSDYLQAERPPLGRLRSADLALRRGLATARTAPAQRRVFTAFAASVGGARIQLERVPAPAPLTAWHRREVARLGRLRNEALSLVAALRHRDSAALRAQLSSLRTDVAGRDAVAAERAAIQAYDAREAQVAALTRRVAAERARIARRLS